MNELREYFAAGGMVVWVLTGLAVLLWGLILEQLLSQMIEKRACSCGDMEKLIGLRRMGFIRAGIVLAPLLGLLGTVTGMIDTFQAMLISGQTADMGRGIREALLTTQYGLIIAAPAMVAECVLIRQREKKIESQP